MAVVEQETGTEKSSSTARSKTNRKEGSKSSSKTPGMASGEIKKKKRVRASRAKAAAVDGAEQLRRAADRRVARKSEELVNMLTENALKGDLASARMLVGLAERKKPEPEEEECGPSLMDQLVEQLAAEPQWEGEPEDKSERAWGPGWRSRDVGSRE